MYLSLAYISYTFLFSTNNSVSVTEQYCQVSDNLFLIKKKSFHCVFFHKGVVHWWLFCWKCVSLSHTTKHFLELIVQLPRPLAK